MALNKSKRWFPCFIHCLLYTLVFTLITTDGLALFLIFSTHYIQDRYGWIKYFIWLKNHMNPTLSYPALINCNMTGYFDDWIDTEPQTKHSKRPKFITTWLFIITDNTYHLVCNFLILKWITT